MATESKHILAGKKGIIFGVINETSLAWAVAKQCVNEGATIVLTNTKAAVKLGTTQQLASSINMPFIPCDATKIDDLEHLLT
ncbi:MAG: SDR family oxidoreductase, partial [Bacteroidales bacterium]|nr:SDR family oxidoreductase [Bacteroidales bacterium]